MAFDLDAFLKDLGPSEDEEKTLRAVFGKPERVQYLEKNQLRQADYSKSMNDLKKAQSDLQTQTDRLNAEAAEWASLTAKEKEGATKLRTDLEASQARVLALTQRVQRVAADAGLDPQKALEGIEQTPPPKKEDPPAPAIDTSKFVGADQFGEFGNFMFTLATEIPMLAQEHFELTGQRLDTRELRQELMARGEKAAKGDRSVSLDPRKAWEEKYGIPEKREVKAKAARDAEIAEAETRGYQRARSEEALPSASTQVQHSPFLKSRPETSKLDRPQPESGVRSAAAALATGKYRQQPVGTAAK